MQWLKLNFMINPLNGKCINWLMVTLCHRYYQKLVVLIYNDAKLKLPMKNRLTNYF